LPLKKTYLKNWFHCLKDYRESTREQRLLEQHQFEQEKQQLQLEMKQLKERSVIEQGKLAELHQQYRLLQQSQVEKEKQHQQAMLSMASLQEQMEQLKQDNMEHRQASQHWQQQFQVVEKKWENKLVEFISLQSDNHLVNQQLKDAKQLLREARDQNKYLASEKWELVQEKAQLEGQMKQMQKMVAV
jgi:chromosome segregation ATPase